MQKYLQLQPQMPKDEPPRSPLLSLPAELRLEIWEYLLAPKSNEASWLSPDFAITTITRKVSPCPRNARGFYILHDDPLLEEAPRPCECAAPSHTIPAFLFNTAERLGPAILAVNRAIYHEALPCLYQKRAFSFFSDRTYSSGWDRLADSWYFQARWLESRSDFARRHIERMTLLLPIGTLLDCTTEQRHYFDLISSRVPRLKILDLKVADFGNYYPSWTDTSCPLQDRRFQTCFGSVLAFAKAKINIGSAKGFPNVSCAKRSKLGDEGELFKTEFEPRLGLLLEKHEARNRNKTAAAIDDRGEAALGDVPLLFRDDFSGADRMSRLPLFLRKKLCD
ncbi:hypothetical protein K402DRAFT_34288 [Aulographum hederae CBS 113979]|uniref:F-box domain-containing protein n=1 Tax=Aulographum hederae CBS 113979 TaxID=1176131 RepID=A0A6G1H5P8_9PEZI|nr:hypothetical protein K402DRAFT_34288 [Aulographum hederae CBS 113979]